MWMQVYELAVDQKTNKPSATVEHDIGSAANDLSAIHILESEDQMGNLGKQMTLKGRCRPGISRQALTASSQGTRQHLPTGD